MPVTFITSARGTPHSNLANINIAFLHDAKLRNTVWYDEFLDRILTGTPPREWTDADDTRAAVYLQQRHGLTGVSSRQVNEVVNRVARDSPQNCVCDWLRALVWDQQPRIQEAFCDYWDATPNARQPHDHLRAISQNFFLGLVARAFLPGCQFDNIVVFESSQQGVGKTSALRALGGAWYAAAHERVTHKDFFQDLQGKWLIEISELSAFSQSQVESIKHAVSTPTDRFRGSYDRRSADHPRRCVFAGTTNHDDWGHDETGMRRFWPVTVGLVNIAALTAIREQLFAEARTLFESGVSWWNTPPTTIDVQADRQNYDEWTEPIMEWVDLQQLQGVQTLTLRDIAAGALKVPLLDFDKKLQMRIAKILKLNKWARIQARVSGRPSKLWASVSTLSGNGGYTF